MGWMSAEPQQQAAEYLVEVLLASETFSVRYSVFYDGTDETFERIRVGMGFEEDEDTCAELAIDLAAGALAEAGIVKLTTLDDKLADDEQDYLIEIDEEGLEKLESGVWPTFRGLDL